VPNDAIVSCHGIVQIYRSESGEVHALRGIDASFEPGRLTAVVGPSGSGKSTLLRILAMTERPTAGTLTIAGVDVQTASARRIRRLRREALAVVSQRATHNLYPHLTVEEHLLLGTRRRRLVGDAGADARAASLEAVGLGHRRHARPPELSGGEQQRLAVAMAAIGQPALVLADEPTAELDPLNGAAVIDLLRASAAGGASVIVNTHDPVVAAAADRVLALHHGTLHSERLEGAGTVAVIDSVGRVQLPPDALAMFPELRATISYDAGRVILGRPEPDVEGGDRHV
jgi:putative ABC transport system ATP-binding protein